MEILQGEQFVRYIGGTNIDYDLCSQIVLACYKEKTKEIALTWVKVADEENYPDAELLEKSDNPNYKLKILVTSEMTEALDLGVYHMEAKRTLIDDTTTIIKGQTPFFNVKKSVTTTPKKEV